MSDVTNEAAGTDARIRPNRFFAIRSKAKGKYYDVDRHAWDADPEGGYDDLDDARAGAHLMVVLDVVGGINDLEIVELEQSVRPVGLQPARTK